MGKIVPAQTNCQSITNFENQTPKIFKMSIFSKIKTSSAATPYYSIEHVHSYQICSTSHFECSMSLEIPREPPNTCVSMENLRIQGALEARSFTFQSHFEKSQIFNLEPFSGLSEPPEALWSHPGSPRSFPKPPRGFLRNIKKNLIFHHFCDPSSG